METGNHRVVAKTGVGVEPFVEVVGGVEHIRKQKVEEGPQLVKVVLERSSCQEKTVRGLDLPDHGREFTLLVLNPVSLVYDHVLPVKLLKDRLLPKDHLVGGDNNIPASGHHYVTDKCISSLLVTLIEQIDDG